jgi:hypothetical protein
MGRNVAVQPSKNASSIRPVPLVPASDPDTRAWQRDDLVTDEPVLFYTLPDAAQREIAEGIAFAKANGLTVDTVEQQDFRIPSFAGDVPELRERLDTGRGFFVLRGIGADCWTEAEAEIISWVICNYLGQPIRQGIGQVRPILTRRASEQVPNAQPSIPITGALRRVRLVIWRSTATDRLRKVATARLSARAVSMM